MWLAREQFLSVSGADKRSQKIFFFCNCCWQRLLVSLTKNIQNSFDREVISPYLCNPLEKKEHSS
jgi:hypothetical protein